MGVPCPHLRQGLKHRIEGANVLKYRLRPALSQIRSRLKDASLGKHAHLGAVFELEHLDTGTTRARAHQLDATRTCSQRASKRRRAQRHANRRRHALVLQAPHSYSSRV